VEAGLSGAERKLVTVLFADLVGSTEAASEADPERVRATLERFYEAMAAEVEVAGGTVEKFAGDAVLAAFGAPAALEDHAERALHAALAMQRRIRELDGGRLQLRIGINTGEVVVGGAREGSSFVTGDAVNVAARLEQAAEAGEILAGERTVSTVRGAFEFGEPTTIAAKGKPEGVRCRRLVRALSLMRPRGVGGLRQAFVGRERELELLEAAYRAAVERRGPELVTIVGDAGVGKTRLVRELWQWLAEQVPQPVQRTGRCLSYGQVTYWALGEVLREQLGLLDSDPPEAALERLRGREILGLALGLDVAGDLHPMVARDRFQDAWVELFGELAESRPAALLVEDVHWAEEPLLELLEHLLAALRSPLLLIATARPELVERRPGFGVRARGEMLQLEPLDSACSDRLLAELLASDPPRQLKVLVARAEGNPFFVEEILGSLVDQGLLERRNGGWDLRGLPSGFAVPDTVQAVVAARIDLLEPSEKAALQAASVIGRVFWSGPIYELLGALRALAPHRQRQRSEVRRACILGGDAGVARDVSRPGHLRRDVQPARVPHHHEIGDVEAPARPRAGERLDRPGPRAQRAGDPCAGAHTHLARLLEPRRGRCPGGRHTRRTVGRCRASLLCLDGARVHGVRRQPFRRSPHVGAAALRAPGRDPRP
jgi:class 3 adenylate cyclase